MVTNPFSQENLNQIFKVSARYPNRIISRESSWLEFKEKFGFGSMGKYAKSMAAFSNAKGGYIVFGIKDNPHDIVGVNEEGFNRVDPARITNELNEIFSPEIHWDIHTYEFQEKVFSLIYTYESANKPVVAKKSSGEIIKEAEIYYRYRGRSEKVKYPELLAILDERRMQEQNRWMSHFEKISKIGLDNTAILDANTGLVEGAAGSFFIDENLLHRLKFIKEGQFVEEKAEPTLKLIGQLQAVKDPVIVPVQKVYTTKTRGIRTDDIISDFLNQNKVDNPIEYVKQICWEFSSTLPVYYYILQSGENIQDVIGSLEEIKSRSQAQCKLIERLSAGKEYAIKILNTGSKATQRKRYYRNAVINREISEDNLPTDYAETKYFLQSIRTLKQTEIELLYILQLLLLIYNRNYGRESGLTAEIRYSIAQVDIVMFKDKIECATAMEKAL